MPRGTRMPWDAPRSAVAASETRSRHSAQRHYRRRVARAQRSLWRAFWGRRPRRRQFGGFALWCVLLLTGLVVLAVKVSLYLVMAVSLTACWPFAWLADRLYG
jgi:hypothetical protein